MKSVTSCRWQHRLVMALLPVFSLMVAVAPAQVPILSSPDSRIQVQFQLSPAGAPQFSATYAGRPLLHRSPLGVVLADGTSFAEGLVLTQQSSGSHRSEWSPVWGEESTITDEHRWMKLTLQTRGDQPRSLLIEFRVFNDGIAFRYAWPTQPHLNHFIVKEERSAFALTGDHKAWWIPGDYDTNEYYYTTSPLSEVDAAVADKFTEIGLRVPFSPTGVQTPLMMKSREGLYLNIHEAALVNYPAMQLEVDKQQLLLRARLVPDAVGNAAYLQAPAQTPWRTLLVSDKATGILASRTILNLNEPAAIADPSFIRPTKYVGLWWEMHVGRSSWDYAGTQDGGSAQGALKPSGRHGATTARVKQYIDFAAKHGFDGVLVEGWNTGWEDWAGNWKEDVFDFVTPYPDFDLPELSRYAAGKQVKLIMHHETSGSVTNYERYMDTAYRLMKNFGYDAVKTGYVGRIIPRGEHHDGQWMVNHFNRVARKTAGYRLMVNMHESVRPTGLHRTWPNWIAAEAARGNEFNAWSVGNPPEHETILPFTRLMGGPMDYTPGIFDIKLDRYKPGAKEQVHTTLAKQLALYVTLYSPLQMAADLPEAYEQKPDALQFIKDVAVDWDASWYLEAEPGDYLTIARKARGRNEWFAGAITDENGRTATIDLSFLPPGRKYRATLYLDAQTAHWQDNPTAYVIENKTVQAGELLKLALAPGGGAAIRILPQ